ncbi:DNA-directed RNA polymerase II subunit RPB11 [Enteropsectra breve]|nr:DNA-directed RNA polymerase II subunit RPB11 [Enteropsectra breve]
MVEVSVTPSTSAINTLDIVIEGETHTAGSCIVDRLQNDPSCLFAAYRVAHPTDHFMSMRVQGNDVQNAKEILKNGISEIIKDIDDLIQQVEHI